MPRHCCPSANRVAPTGYAIVTFRGWKASIADFGKWQKKPSRHNLQERQSSTSSKPYGECNRHPTAREPHVAQSQSVRIWVNLALRGRLPLARGIIQGAYPVQQIQVWSKLLTLTKHLGNQSTAQGRTQRTKQWQS